MRDQAGPSAVSSLSDVQLINAAGNGRFVLVCEHATNFIPPEFSDLGLNEAERHSHIAWDIGAFEVAKALSERLNAPLIAPVVSRLVYDCNRPVQVQSAVPEKSEIYDIPGNAGLTDDDRSARSDRFYQPYRKALMNVIEQAAGEGRQPAIVTIHSFTKLFHGQNRILDLGLVHDEDARLANEIVALNQVDGAFIARTNEPYGPRDGVTYTLVEHALGRGLLNVMIEIRNDLIANPDGQTAMANRLAGYLLSAVVNLDADEKRRVSQC